MTDGLPIIDLDEQPSPASSPDVAGILLAAGTSSRYGSANKLLVTVDGTPVVRLAATTLLEADLDPVVVVTGYESPSVREALGDLPVSFVDNPEYDTGQASSVATGIGSLPDTVDASVIALGDMPFVDPATIDILVDAFAAGTASALAAGFQGARGNPVLFDRVHFNELQTLTGDTGGRDILLDPSTNAAIVETGDPGVRRDVDESRDVNE